MEKISEISIWCQGVKNLTQTRCSNRAIKGGMYCNLHLPDSPLVCQGIKRNGTKCKAFKRKGLDFCCPEHDPAKEPTTDPLDFRFTNLRKNRMDSVLEYRNNMDLYSDEKIDMKKDARRLHLDHHVELNLGRDAYDSLKGNGMKSQDAERLKSNIKVTFNKNFNLSFTDETVNMKKTAAMQNFADAYKTDNLKGGLEDYVLESFHMATRGKTSRIIAEVITSFDLVINHMRDNYGTTTSNTLYVEKLEDMFAAMKLA